MKKITIAALLIGAVALVLAFAFDADLVERVALEDVERAGHLADLVGAGRIGDVDIEIAGGHLAHGPDQPDDRSLERADQQKGRDKTEGDAAGDGG